MALGGLRGAMTPPDLYPSRSQELPTTPSLGWDARNTRVGCSLIAPCPHCVTVGLHLPGAQGQHGHDGHIFSPCWSLDTAAQNAQAEAIALTVDP